MAERNFLVLVAKSEWYSMDKADLLVENVGFEIVDIPPQDAALYNRILERYAS